MRTPILLEDAALGFGLSAIPTFAAWVWGSDYVAAAALFTAAFIAGSILARARPE